MTVPKPVTLVLCSLFLTACDSDDPDPYPLAPATPTRLVAQAGEGEVVLTWNANPEDDLTYYNVYQGEESGSLSKVAEVPVGTETYTAAGLTNGTTYFFAIDAENTSGRRSARTEEASATPGTQEPPAPTATFEGLGDLPGGEYRSSARAVSANGSVVVGSSDIPLNPNQGFNREAFRLHKDASRAGKSATTGNTNSSFILHPSAFVSYLCCPFGTRIGVRPPAPREDARFREG